MRKDLAEARKRTDEIAKRLSRGGAEADAAFRAALDAQLEAERKLAAARGEEHAIPFELGVRWSGGAPLPHVLSSGHRSFVAFYLEEHDPDWDGTYVRVIDPSDEEVASLALAEFKGCSAIKLGLWADARHFLFVFHDETVEAVARDVEIETFRESMPALLAQTTARLWPD